MRRDDYDEYLRSDWWKQRKKRVLEFAGNKCEKCGKTSGLEVHHRNYDNLYCEEDKDLIVLCYECHREHHIEERNRLLGLDKVDSSGFLVSSDRGWPIGVLLFIVFIWICYSEKLPFGPLFYIAAIALCLIFFIVINWRVNRKNTLKKDI